MNRIRIATAVVCITAIGASIAYFALEHIKHDARAVDAGVVEFKKGNYEAAIRILGPYADRGNERAEFNVGIAYALGLGVRRDRERAHAMLHRSMGPKALEMYTWLAKSFENGDGVAKDPAEAMAWYRIAADEGSDQARTRLEREKKSALSAPQASSAG